MEPKTTEELKNKDKYIYILCLLAYVYTISTVS